MTWHLPAGLSPGSSGYSTVAEREELLETTRGMAPAYGRWPWAKLGNVVDLRLSSVDKKTLPGERSVRLCNYSDVYRHRVIRADMDYMEATATDREIRNCRLEPGDVVITKDSETADDIGVPAIVGDSVRDLVCGYHLAILRPLRADLDGRFLHYALLTEGAKRQFRIYANGITRFGLRMEDINRIRIPLPPIPEQRKIAAILSSIDDAIEKTQALVGQVRIIKGGVMQELFTRGMPGRHTRFKQTEIGRVPAEWTTAPGTDLFRLSGGYGPSAITFDDQGECLFVKVDSFNHRANRRLIVHASDRFSEANNRSIRTQAQGSLAFPKRGAAIFKNRVKLLGTKAAVDPNLMVMTPKSALIPHFLMYLLIHIELFNLIDNSGIPQLNNKHLYPKVFPVPSIEEQEEIANSIRSIDDRIAVEVEKIDGLSRLKVALMEVLLTGSPHVSPDTEAA